MSRVTWVPPETEVPGPSRGKKWDYVWKLGAGAKGPRLGWLAVRKLGTPLIQEGGLKQKMLSSPNHSLTPFSYFCITQMPTFSTCLKTKRLEVLLSWDLFFFSLFLFTKEPSQTFHLLRWCGEQSDDREFLSNLGSGPHPWGNPCWLPQTLMHPV